MACSHSTRLLARARRVVRVAARHGPLHEIGRAAMVEAAIPDMSSNSERLLVALRFMFDVSIRFSAPPPPKKRKPVAEPVGMSTGCLASIEPAREAADRSSTAAE